MTGGVVHMLLGFFFAPRAVRPNSPVTVEQKRDQSPLMAKSPIKAGADDRIPPSQECSPHPGRKQQGKQQNTTSENAKTGESGPIETVQMSYKKVSRTQRQPCKTTPNIYWQQTKTPAIREKAEIPISVVKQVRLQLA